MAISADRPLDGPVDGIDAIILLRERLGRDVPGILVTADQSREVKERAKARGTEYFSKPMKPAQLRSHLPHLSAGTRAAPAAASGGQRGPAVPRRCEEHTATHQSTRRNP